MNIKFFRYPIEVNKIRIYNILQKKFPPVKSKKYDMIFILFNYSTKSLLNFSIGVFRVKLFLNLNESFLIPK